MPELKAVKLITEEFDDVKLIESEGDSGSKVLYLEGIYSTHSAENKNGRRYKKEILEREINKIMPEVKAKRLYGQLNHPQTPDIDLKEACILIESLNWNDANVMGKSSVLETPMGNIVRACLKRGIVGISSRGLGTVNEDGWVNEDYQLLTWDVVSQPSNRGSWVKGICESKEYLVNESGAVVREVSSLSEKEKKEAVKDAVHDLDEQVRLMAEAIVEERLAEPTELIREAYFRLSKSNRLMKEAYNEIARLRAKCGEAPSVSSISEEQAKKVYIEILKKQLAEKLEKLF